MNTYKKLYSMLSLCQRAGQLRSGEFMCENSIKSKEALLVIVATDASENTVRLFKQKCDYYQIPFYQIGSKEELGRSIGKEFRASLAVVGTNFAIQIEKLLQTL